MHRKHQSTVCLMLCLRLSMHFTLMEYYKQATLGWADFVHHIFHCYGKGIASVSSHEISVMHIQVFCESEMSHFLTISNKHFSILTNPRHPFYIHFTSVKCTCRHYENLKMK